MFTVCHTRWTKRCVLSELFSLISRVWWKKRKKKKYRDYDQRQIDGLLILQHHQSTCPLWSHSTWCKPIDCHSRLVWPAHHDNTQYTWPHRHTSTQSGPTVTRSKTESHRETGGQSVSQTATAAAAELVVIILRTWSPETVNGSLASSLQSSGTSALTHRLTVYLPRSLLPSPAADVLLQLLQTLKRSFHSRCSTDRYLLISPLQCIECQRLYASQHATIEPCDHNTYILTIQLGIIDLFYFHLNKKA